MTAIDWTIVGGESGPRSRPMNPQWVDEIERLCQVFGAKFFFKQWGGTTKELPAGATAGTPERNANLKDAICNARREPYRRSVAVRDCKKE